MKNKILLLISLFIFLLPFTVKAENTTNVTLSGPTKVTTGEDFTLTINMQFKDVVENNPKSLGIYGVLTELNFNDKDFTITKVTSSDAFNSSILITTDGQYYLYSTLKNDYEKSKCSDKVLFCETYTASITFSVNNTTATKGEINISNYTGILLNMITDINKDVLDNNFTLLTESGTDKTKYAVEIAKSNNEVKNKTSIATSSDKSSSNILELTKKEVTEGMNDRLKHLRRSETPTKEEKNNYLESLTIEGYELEFDKYQNIYKINVSNEVTSLNITAKTESDKATYTITGAENFEENNNKVVIEVTSLEGEVRSYIINVSKEEEVKEKEEEKEEPKIVITSEQKKLIVEVFLAITAVVLIIIVIVRIRDRHIEKNIKKL